MNGKNIVKITVTTIVDRIGLVTSMLFLSTKVIILYEGRHIFHIAKPTPTTQNANMISTMLKDILLSVLNFLSHMLDGKNFFLRF